MKINYIYLDITDKCNLSCIYCCKRKEHSKTFGDIKKKVLNNILNFGICNGATSITLSGGEPCLHSKFDDILEKVKKLEYESLRVMTNGHLFKMQNNFSNIKLIDEICFSIDSADIIKNEITRKGFENGSLEEIRKFNEEYSDILLTIKSTITKHNMGNIETLLQFAKKYNFSKVTFGYCLPLGQAKDDRTFNEVACTPVEMLIVQKGIEHLKLKYNDIEIIEPCIVFGCKLLMNNDGFDLHIDEQGNIFPCDGMNDDEYIIANIQDDNLEQTMISNLRKIQTTIESKNEVCKKCTISGNCEGVCLLYGNPSNEYDGDKFCAFRRIKVFSNKMIKDVVLNE